MRREPAPELRRAAEDLFAACRSEQPSQELAGRISALGARDVAHSAVRPSVRHTDRSRPRRLLLAALVLSLGGTAMWFAARAPAPLVAISAERAPVAVPLARDARAAREAPPVATSGEPSALEGEAAKPVVPPPLKAPARSKPRAPVSTAAPSAAPSAEPAAPRPSLAHDLQALMSIRSTLRAGDGAKALDLLDRRARTGGELEAEATVLRIEALASLGRRQEASELARRFVQANPNSALADRAKAFVR